MKAALRYLQMTFFGVCIVALPIALWVLHRLIPVGLGSPPPPSHSELLSVLLTGLTVSMAALAVVIAGLAIWGYHAIRDEASSIAEESTKREFGTYVKSEDFENLIRGVMSPIIEQETKKVFEGAAYSIAGSGPSDDEGDFQKRLSEEYPKSDEKNPPKED